MPEPIGKLRAGITTVGGLGMDDHDFQLGRAIGLRLRILSGMGEEGREPIYVQVRGLRMGRLPRYFSSIPFGSLWTPDG